MQIPQNMDRRGKLLGPHILVHKWAPEHLPYRQTTRLEMYTAKARSAQTRTVLQACIWDHFLFLRKEKKTLLCATFVLQNL